MTYKVSSGTLNLCSLTQTLGRPFQRDLSPHFHEYLFWLNGCDQLVQCLFSLCRTAIVTGGRYVPRVYGSTAARAGVDRGATAAFRCLLVVLLVCDAQNSTQ